MPKKKEDQTDLEGETKKYAAWVNQIQKEVSKEFNDYNKKAFDNYKNSEGEAIIFRYNPTEITEIGIPEYFSEGNKKQFNAALNGKKKAEEVESEDEQDENDNS